MIMDYNKNKKKFEIAKCTKVQSKFNKIMWLIDYKLWVKDWYHKWHLCHLKLKWQLKAREEMIWFDHIEAQNLLRYFVNLY